MNPFNSPLNGFALLALIGAVAFFLLARGLRRRPTEGLAQVKRETESVRKMFESVDPDTALADAPREVLRWQVALHDTARELMAELDTKMIATQVLIRQAEETIARLEEAKTRLSSMQSEPAPDRDPP